MHKWSGNPESGPNFNFQGNSILKKLLPGLELRRGGLADELGSAIVVHDGTDLDR